MKTFLTIIWHVPFGGFLWSLLFAVLGGIMCLTVVGSPIGLGLLQFSKFLLSPFHRVMISNSDLEEVTEKRQNIAWKIFSIIVRILYFPVGLICAMGAIFIICIEFVSLIGIPCGIVWAKSLKTIFNPVNKICVSGMVGEEVERKKAEKELNKYHNPAVAPVASVPPISPIPPVSPEGVPLQYAQFYPQPLVKSVPNGTAILVLGILSFLFAWFMGIGLILGIIALILAIVSGNSMRRDSQENVIWKNRGQYTAGWILALLGTLSGIGYIIFGFYFLKEMFPHLF